ncbi:MAG: hypothetical protein A2173_05000 [Planctomycetes bacterium RBG_13_44_8b]|nr:MAG: hypothetical protein A2173_05000 [Planctomycetes bacterium RBG_13_44_8b]
MENQKSKIKNQNCRRGLFLFGLIVLVCSLFKSKVKNDDLKRMEFSSSAQKIGVGFTDIIRDIFRYKWIKKI